MPFPANVPELTDGVVLLRAHRLTDADGIVEQSNDPASMRWTTVPRPYAVEQAHEFLALIESGWNDGRGNLHWAICAVADPERFLGTIDLREKPGGTAEVGFGLHPDGRGQGLMARAVRLLAGHYFTERGGRRLYWYAERGNWASWRVAWACGFRHHGLLPMKVAGLADVPGDPARDGWVASVGADDDLDRPVAPWYVPPVIEGEGIRLRPWRDSDGESAEDADHPGHFVPAGAIPTPANWDDWYLRRLGVMALGSSVNWCIADAASDRALGEALVFVHGGSLDAADTAELGYYLFPSARGRGAAKEAARMASAHAFASRDVGGLGLRRLVAETAADNVASNAVLEAAGFTRWGHEAAATAPDGSVGPADHWELLAP